MKGGRMKSQFDLSIVSDAIAAIAREFSPLSDRCREDLLAVFQLKNGSKNTILVREGEYCHDTYFIIIITGSIRAFYLKDGKDITDWFAFEGDFVNSIQSYFLDVPSPHYMEALEPITYLEVKREDVERLCSTHHDFERLVRLGVTRTMLQLQQRIMSLQFETAQQKYENLLAIRPDIVRRVPLTHIASFLGITLETLSRVRGNRRGI
jgi:CRP-like cAMP-binding protein